MSTNFVNFILPIRRRLGDECNLFIEGNCDRHKSVSLMPFSPVQDDFSTCLDQYFCCNYSGCKQSFYLLSQVVDFRMII